MYVTYLSIKLGEKLNTILPLARKKSLNKAITQLIHTLSLVLYVEMLRGIFLLTINTSTCKGHQSTNYSLKE